MTSPPLKAEREGEVLRLSGSLVYGNVREALAESAGWLDGCSVSRIDLSALERVDSAGLAFLIALRRRCGRVELAYPPHDLKALARLSDVDGLLNVAAEDIALKRTTGQHRMIRPEDIEAARQKSDA